MKHRWNDRRLGAILLALCLFFTGCNKAPDAPGADVPSEIMTPEEGDLALSEEPLDETLLEGTPEWDEAPVAAEQPAEAAMAEAEAPALEAGRNLSDDECRVIAAKAENTKNAAETGEPESDGLQEYAAGHPEVALFMNGMVQNSARLASFAEHVQSGTNDTLPMIHGDGGETVIWIYSFADGKLSAEKATLAGADVKRETVPLEGITVTDDAYTFSDELGLRYSK